MRSASPHAPDRQEIELQRRKCSVDTPPNPVMSAKHLMTRGKDVYKKIHRLARPIVDRCRTGLILAPLKCCRGGNRNDRSRQVRCGNSDVRQLTEEREQEGLVID
jgi:hypothetical protein